MNIRFYYLDKNKQKFANEVLATHQLLSNKTCVTCFNREDVHLLLCYLYNPPEPNIHLKGIFQKSS